MRRCVWSRKFVNEEALAPPGEGGGGVMAQIKKKKKKKKKTKNDNFINSFIKKNV